MSYRDSKNFVGEQLSLFAIPFTANIEKGTVSGLLKDLQEISEPHKSLMNQRKVKGHNK